MFGSIDYFSLAKWMFVGFFIVFFPASIWFEDEIIAALDRRKAKSKIKIQSN
jgi:hypothetical protein